MKDRVRLDSNRPSDKALKLWEFLMANIKGQDRVIKDLVEAIEIFESGLFAENRPIYVCLSSGPSGVGKTYTAELLAEYWFGKRNAFTKIACEAYSEDHSISKLIGSPAGYVGHWNPNSDRNYGTPPILWQGSIDRFDKKVDSRAMVKKDQLEAIGEAIIKRALELQKTFVGLFLYFTSFFDEDGVIMAKDLPKLSKAIKDALPLVEEYQELVKELQNFNQKIEKERRYSAAKQAFKSAGKARSIILFDEIEKASPTLHNILLNVIDKAELQLANGMITDFSNSVIFMTTNVGSRAIADILNPKKAIGFAESGKKNEEEVKDKQIYQKSLEELKRAFPPEFLARLDRINVYRPLDREILRGITDVELKRFQDKVLQNLPVLFHFDERVKELFLDKATKKPENGARLIKNVIMRYLRKPLCRLKNRGEIDKGDIIYVILEEAEGDDKFSIVFEREKRPEKSE